MRELIAKLMNVTHSTRTTREIQKNAGAVEFLRSLYPWAKCIHEMLHCFQHNITSCPTCQICGKQVPFLKTSKKYARGCCKAHTLSIAMKDPEVANKIRATGRVVSSETINKRKQTMLERYGVTNASHLPSFLEKSKQTCMKKYGVEHPSQSHQILAKKKLTIAKKHADRLCDVVEPLFSFDEFNMCTKPLNWKCCMCGTEFRDVIRTSHRSFPLCPSCHPKSSTSLAEKEIHDFVKSLGVNVRGNARDVIPPKELDVFMPDHDLAIEHNGLWWHQEKNHVEKTKLCQDRGIRLLQFFEDEWSMKRDLCQSIIKSKLGMYEHRLFARKCVIGRVSASVAREFFEHNHIQGGRVLGSHGIGLWCDGELVMCASFGVPRFQSTADYELIRMASLQNVQVVGGASRLISAWAQMHPHSSLISYADLRYSDGGVYQALGMKLSHVTPPSYFYCKPGSMIRESRTKYQKHRLKTLFPDLFDPDLTEFEIMRRAGYFRVFDCGCAVYRLDVS